MPCTKSDPLGQRGGLSPLEDAAARFKQSIDSLHVAQSSYAAATEAHSEAASALRKAEFERAEASQALLRIAVGAE